MSELNDPQPKQDPPDKSPPVGTPQPTKGPPVFPPGSVIKEILTRKSEGISEKFLRDYKVL
jgi:hypothetical protein